jgi:catechol 2,3-dioxygenase-like lactoylglutathione lyase family enzyme
VFDHLTIRASDRDATERFYNTVLPVLGISPVRRGTTYSIWGGEFSLAAGPPVTQRLHIGFGAPSREHVDAFWRAGIDAGYRDDGEPGPRPQYGPDYYGGFLLDPDGNSAEAVHHDTVRPVLDHLWIRVADLGASKRFYETVAPFGGFALRNERPDRVQFTGETGSFSIVAGTPAENLHLAFPADDDATVRAFHDALTGAGYRDNGAPGERSEYHPGYYGAFVLDPDGNNVEIVNHNWPS